MLSTATFYAMGVDLNIILESEFFYNELILAAVVVKIMY